MTIKYGYKVVYKALQTDIYFSCIMTDITERVIYKPNKYTSRRYKNWGPLAVFKTLKSAKIFFNNYFTGIKCYTYKIFKCKYKVSKQKELWRYNSFFVPRINRSKMITLKESMTNPPKGTDFANQVMLLEEVKL